MRHQLLTLITITMCLYAIVETPVYTDPDTEIELPNADHRTAIAILESAEYVRFGEDPHIRQQTISDKIAQCLPQEKQAGDGLSLRSLTLAISAIEQYNRTAFVRDVEFLIARAWLAITGSIPNYSYGISQIQAKVARKVLTTKEYSEIITDQDLLDLLQDDCLNLFIAANYINSIISNKRDASLLDQVRSISVNYNGDIEPISSVNYRKVLAATYNILGPDSIHNDSEYDFSERMPAWIGSNPTGMIDIRFDADIIPYISEGISITSPRNIVYLVAHTDSITPKDIDTVKSQSVLLKNMLVENGVRNEIRLAYRVVESPLDKNKLFAIYINTNPNKPSPVHFFK